MVSGFSKRSVCVTLILLCSMVLFAQDYRVTATQLKIDQKDLSQRDSKIVDQNGEKCALLKFETPIPALFKFNLGASLSVEKRVNKDDEVWIWVTPDARKMTIECENCQALRDYRVSLKSACVYRAKLTTGLPQETSTHQHLNIYCEQVPFSVSIDGAEPEVSSTRLFHKQLTIGTHDVQVSAPLYKTLQKQIRLFRSGAVNDTVKLDINYGEVQLTVNHKDYTVYVDDVPQTNSRVVRAEPGLHRITIRKDRYEPYETTVKLKAGNVFNLPPVNLVPAYAVFTITAKERETEIWVDDKLRGHETATLALDYGIHTIEGRREGYDTWEYNIHEFSATSERTIAIPKLIQQFGMIRISTYPHDAVVRFDGAEVTTNNGVYVAQHVPTGKHYVHVRREDYKSVIDTFTLASGQIFTQDYQLTHVSMGFVNIRTDPDAVIHVHNNDGEEGKANEWSYLGKGEYQGKLTAGEQLIRLTNIDNISCTHRIFVNGTKEEQTFRLPYMRDLKIRTSAPIAKIKLESNRRVYPIRAHKKTKIEPQKYVLTATANGYKPYIDTVDLSQQGTKYTVFHAMMTKLGDSIPPAAPKSNIPLFRRYFDHAGDWYFGIVDVGYMFDFSNFGHYLTFGAAPIRWKMLGVNPADFEICVSDTLGTAPRVSMAYRPKVSLVLPAKDKFAFTFYAGLSYRLFENTATPTAPRSHLLGGISMLINSSSVMPMHIFGEYQYPLDNKDGINGELYKQFRVGISFSLGVDR